MKKIFLSYCWQDDKYANLIDSYFQQVGIKLIRDRRDLTYGTSISAFAKKIRKTSYAICIISDEFLKSENCMYEIVEFQKDDNFTKKICPIVINYPGSEVSLKPESIEQYAAFWQDKIKYQNELINKITDNIQKEEQIRQLKKYTLILNGIREFLFFLKDAIYISNSNIDNLGIKTINENVFHKIGINPSINIEELYAITQLNSIEEAENQLANYLHTHLIKENEFYYYTRANIYDKFGYYDLAFYNFKLAYKTSDKFILAYESIIMMYVKGIYNPDQQFMDIINKLEKIDDSNTTLKMAQGILALKQDKCIEAIHLFETALNCASNQSRCYIYNNIANSYEKIGDLNKAELNYCKSIEENPRYYQAYNNLSLLYLMKLKDIKKALITIETCLEINSSYCMAQNTLGLIQEELGNNEEALSSYLDSLYNSRGNDQYFAPINNIGRVLDFEMNDRNCKIYYELAYKVNPNSLVCNFNLGNYYRKYAHDNKIAEKFLNRALEMQPNNILCNMAKGLLRYNMDDYISAKTYFSYAYLCNKYYGPACLCLALCMLNLGDELKDIINLLDGFNGEYMQINSLCTYLKCDKINYLAYEKDLINTIEYDYVNIPEQIVKTLYIKPVVRLEDAYQYIKNHFFEIQ